MSKELESQLRLSEELTATREDAAELQRLCEEELTELSRLERRSRSFQEEEAALAELLKLAEVEEAEVQRLKKLMDFEEKLGLPRRKSLLNLLKSLLKSLLNCRIEIQDEMVTLGRSDDPRCSVKALEPLRSC